jgi:hypothetical protein
VLSPFSPPTSTPSYVPKSAQRRVSQEDNTPTTATITPIRTTPWCELLPPKAYYAGATVTASNANFCMVNHSSPRVHIILAQDIMQETVWIVIVIGMLAGWRAIREVWVCDGAAVETMLGSVLLPSPAEGLGPGRKKPAWLSTKVAGYPHPLWKTRA